jgi:hypothetical protein
VPLNSGLVPLKGGLVPLKAGIVPFKGKSPSQSGKVPFSSGKVPFPGASPGVGSTVGAAAGPCPAARKGRETTMRRTARMRVFILVPAGEERISFNLISSAMYVENSKSRKFRSLKGAQSLLKRFNEPLQPLQPLHGAFYHCR